MNIETATVVADEALGALRASRYSEASNLAEQVLMHYPAHGKALEVRAMIAFRERRYRDALDSAQQALSSAPPNPGLLNVLGNALRYLGHLKESEAALREALQLAPHVAETHLNLALTLLDLGRHDKAENYFRNVTSIRRDSERAHFHLGRLALDDGRHDEAVRQLRAATAISDSNLDSKRLLSRALLTSGRTEEALEVASEICRSGDASDSDFRLRANLEFELENQPAQSGLSHATVRGGHLQENVDSCHFVRTRLGLIDVWCSRTGARYFRASGAQWLKYGMPDVIPREDAGLYLAPHPYSRELFVASLPNARVYPGGMLVVSTDDELFCEGIFRDGAAALHRSSSVETVADDGRVLIRGANHLERIAGPVIYLGEASDLFGWFYECLGRAWIVGRMPELESCSVLIGGGLSGWQIDVLEKIGISRSQVVGMPGESAVACDLLHVPSCPVVGWFVAPMAVEFLRRRLTARPLRPERARKRIFLTSRDGRSRPIGNADEVNTLVARYGFEPIDAHGMSFAELARHLSEASAVVGVEGDFMACLFVMAAGASICVLSPRGGTTPRLYFASATLGLKFTYLVCDLDFESNVKLDLCSLTVPIRSLEAYLAKLPD